MIVERISTYECNVLVYKCYFYVVYFICIIITFVLKISEKELKKAVKKTLNGVDVRIL